MKRRLKNFLLCLDQLLLCIVTFGNSDPRETCSSAAWRVERDGKFFGFFRPAIDWLFSWIEADHCRKSHENFRASVGLNIKPPTETTAA